MRCSKAHKIISSYVDSELAVPERSALEAHLKTCPKCRAEFEELKSLSNLFVNAENFKAPYGFHTRVMANISSGKQISRIPVFARFAEAIVVIAVIAFGILSGSFLIKGYMPDKARDVIASLSLDIFDSAPPGTLGGAYLAMTEVRDEK